MEAKEPKDALERRLIKKENWKIAKSVNCNWQEDNCNCDICKTKITGRHMVDGKLSDSFEFGLMCAQCHNKKGNGFGEGKGQLFTKLLNGKWLMTLGFTDDQMMDSEDNLDEDDE